MHNAVKLEFLHVSYDIKKLTYNDFINRGQGEKITLFRFFIITQTI